MVNIREPEMIRDYQVDEWAAPVIEDAEIVPDGRLNWFDAKSSRQPSDEALLTALADGAAWALEALYQRYSRSLYSLAYCRLPINRSLKICCKMHSWLCGDAPPVLATWDIRSQNRKVVPG